MDAFIHRNESEYEFENKIFFMAEKIREQGWLEGIKDSKFQIAKKMKKKKFTVKVISEITGLSVNEIDNL